ncbi:hypothetical protein IU449_28565 [Nocardia higoensis]|uniref:Centromere-binding protein ParB C-terminal domain-containing protein n=1 Tax=Nocardia higoensis TaxID=228599 RepID=A0ABS0DMZ4_9NOCA|nr:hypothetical protein [Nocardia higoensis]MBF6358454.1 hypothetical protein [Nocardia higoensis]
MARTSGRPSGRGKGSSDSAAGVMKDLFDTKVPAESADEPEIDERPAMRRRSDKKKVQGINWDLDLLLYSRDAVIRLGRTYPEEDISSLASLVDVSVREKLAALERKYNGGRPFPPI